VSRVTTGIGAYDDPERRALALALIDMNGIVDLSTAKRLILPGLDTAYRHQQGRRFTAISNDQLHEWQSVTSKPRLRKTQSHQELPRILQHVCKG
jgi:hypothetical protein